MKKPFLYYALGVLTVAVLEYLLRQLKWVELNMTLFIIFVVFALGIFMWGIFKR